MEILKENKIVLIIVVLIIAVLAWYGMNGSVNSNTDSLLSSESTGQDSTLNDRELLQLLTDMKSIHLEGHIFDSPTYKSLHDFGRSIVPEPVGRQDPFAPLPKTEMTVTGGGDLSGQVLLR